MQFVVGATPDTDRTILGAVTQLYARRGIHHAHFSAFRPIRNTPMEHVRATPALREHRLYQVDYLLRDYGFAPRRGRLRRDGNLPLSHDPKTAWAFAHPEHFPLDVRTRVVRGSCSAFPASARRSARRIVAERGSTRMRGLADLRALGVVTTRAGGLPHARRPAAAVRALDRAARLLAAEEDVGASQRIYEVSPGTFR